MSDYQNAFESWRRRLEAEDLLLFIEVCPVALSTTLSHLQILHKLGYLEYNTKHAQYTNVKHTPKVSPFGIALVKKKKGK